MKNCEEITSDIERANFSALSLRERFSVRTHLMLCKDCRSFLKDSIGIDKLLKRKYKHLSKYEFSKGEKEQMKSKL